MDKSINSTVVGRLLGEDRISINDISGADWDRILKESILRSEFQNLETTPLREVLQQFFDAHYGQTQSRTNLVSSSASCAMNTPILVSHHHSTSTDEGWGTEDEVGVQNCWHIALCRTTYSDPTFITFETRVWRRGKQIIKKEIHPYELSRKNWQKLLVSKYNAHQLIFSFMTSFSTQAQSLEYSAERARLGERRFQSIYNVVEIPK